MAMEDEAELDRACAAPKVYQPPVTTKKVRQSASALFSRILLLTMVSPYADAPEPLRRSLLWISSMHRRGKALCRQRRRAVPRKRLPPCCRVVWDGFVAMRLGERDAPVKGWKGGRETERQRDRAKEPKRQRVGVWETDRDKKLRLLVI